FHGLTRPRGNRDESRATASDRSSTPSKRAYHAIRDHSSSMVSPDWVSRWLAGQILKGGGFGLWGDLIVGVIGALLGGFLFGLLGISAGGLLGSLITATVGAIVLLLLLRLIKKA